LFADVRTRELWYCFKAAYGYENVSLLYDREGKIKSRIPIADGVEQGDLLAQFAYDHSMQPIYKRATAGAGLITCAAVHDDFSVVGELKSIITSVRQFKAECDAQSIRLRIPKTRALWPHESAPPADVVAFCEEHKIQLFHRTMPLLGAMPPSGGITTRGTLVQRPDIGGVPSRCRCWPGRHD
jgi:hypothetical protein